MPDTSGNSVNIINIYQKAYKILRKDLKKNNLVPCVLNNFNHTLIINKESDQVYIFFQMTISKSA
jgi:hypothetical protein